MLSSSDMLHHLKSERRLIVKELIKYFTIEQSARLGKDTDQSNDTNKLDESYDCPENTTIQVVFKKVETSS